MKKVFKIIGIIMLSAAVVLFACGIVIPGAMADEEGSIFLALIMATVGMVAGAVVGAFLMYAKNDTAKRVGHGLTIASFVMGLSYGLLARDGSLGAIMMIIGAVFLLLHYIALLVVAIMKRGANEIENPVEDIRIIRIKEWKQLLDEGIISKDEFEEKRVQILGLKAKPQSK